jgi:hypothetical protein
LRSGSLSFPGANDARPVEERDVDTTRRVTAMDAEVPIYCRCGKAVSVRIGALKTQTRFRCQCGGVVARDLRHLVLQLEDIELRLVRRLANLSRSIHGSRYLH